MKYTIIGTLLLMGISTFTFGQGESINKYTEIDAVVRGKWIKGNDATTIADELAYEYDSDEEKVRAIFVWITDNIEYSYDVYLAQKDDKSERRIKAKTDEEYAELLLEQREEDLKTCLKKRGGVESDFSFLFMQMCKAVNIEAGEIEGYLRKSERRIGTMPRRPDHVWNWAIIDGEKQLFDVFLASGSFDKKEKLFTKEFDGGYFMPKPRVMVLDHYPADSTLLMIEPLISQQEFADQPFKLKEYSESKIVEFFPKNGLIPTDATEIEFKFKFEDGEIPHRILLYEKRGLSEQPFQMTDDGYFVLKYQIPENRPRDLKIVIKDSKLYEHEALIYKLSAE